MDKTLQLTNMNTGFTNYLKETLWVGGLQQQVKLLKNALKEIMVWCSLLECDDSFHLVENIQQQEMVPIFRDMNHVVSTYFEELDHDNKCFIIMLTEIN